VEARRRRIAVLVGIALVAVVMLLLTAFTGGGSPAATLTPSTAAASRLLPAGPPTAQTVARLGMLQLDLPISQSRVTAIGYYGAADGALALAPLGTQANAGVLTRLMHKVFGGGSGAPRWYQLQGGQGASTSALDIGAAAGTDVYAPVDGTVVGISKVIVDGKTYGEQVDIQPNQSPSLVVSVSRVKVDTSLIAGSTVLAHSSRIGQVIDFSKIEQQGLARYTNDSGNHVLLEVHPAATLNVR
jgi:hypothetical protein